VSAVIIFETARLLKTFPLFNAYCADGSIHFYEQVNIGFAVDADRGLKVPVIRDADTKSLPEIAAEMQEAVVDYLNDSLPMKSLAGGTFTVTDLSGDGVFAFHPLINQGQSAILGICGEFFPPGSKEGMFNLDPGIRPPGVRGPGRRAFPERIETPDCWLRKCIGRPGSSGDGSPLRAVLCRAGRTVRHEASSVADRWVPAAPPVSFAPVARWVTPELLMNDSLKTIVAELLAVAPDQVGTDRVLSGARLQGSLGRSILDAAVRRRLGIQSQACYTAKTFGELEAAINGTAVVVAANAAPATPPVEPAAAVASEVPSVAPSFAAVPATFVGGTQSSACGVDIELIESLPVTTDFWAHEFYTTNFTPGEIAYCLTQQSPALHFAARWCAKEALKKCEPGLLTEQMRNTGSGFARRWHTIASASRQRQPHQSAARPELVAHQSYRRRGGHAR